MSYEILKEHSGIEEGGDDRGSIGRDQQLFDVLDNDLLEDEMEVDFQPLFEKIKTDVDLSYEDKIGLLQNLAYLLSSGVAGLFGEENCFNQELKDRIIAIGNGEVANEDLIDDVFGQVSAVIVS